MTLILVVLYVVCIMGDTVIHVVCTGRYSYICSMYCGDTVIHVVCIVGYSYTCSMYWGIQLYMCGGRGSGW